MTEREIEPLDLDGLSVAHADSDAVHDFVVNVAINNPNIAEIIAALRAPSAR